MFTFKPTDKNIVEVSRTRLIVVMVLLVLGFSTISLRVFDVVVLNYGQDQGEYATASADENISRAEILDRNGMLLAINLTTASLYANPKVVIDSEEATEKLLTVFPDMDAEALKSRLESDKNFVWIKRNLTPIEQQAVNALGLPGLSFQDEQTRIYPHKNLLSHVLGYVGVDGHGLAGIEKQYDSYLLDKNYNEPLQLSIDVRVQDILHGALTEAIDEFKAKGASGVVMDVNNGEILAMTSLPDFDPHNIGDATVDQKFNRATLGVYEMGSVLKTHTMALGLDSGTITMNDSFDVSKPLVAGRFTIKDYHAEKGFITIPEIFIKSSNIGTAQVAMEVGVDKQKEFLKKLGMLDATEIELPENALPLSPGKWSKVSGMTISYGHGLAVTPVHVVKSISALVNGGRLIPPTLLMRTDDNFVGKQIIKKSTSDDIRKLLRFVVKYGTGSKANARSYLVGGKTGSADKPSHGSYNERAIISSFVGVFPMNKPKYVVFVMVDEPHGNKSTGGFATGGQIAAPVVRNVIAKMGPVLGIQPVDEENYEIRREFWYEEYEEKDAKMASIGSNWQFARN